MPTEGYRFVRWAHVGFVSMNIASRYGVLIIPILLFVSLAVLKPFIRYNVLHFARNHLVSICFELQKRVLNQPKPVDFIDPLFYLLLYVFYVCGVIILCFYFTLQDPILPIMLICYFEIAIIFLFANFSYLYVLLLAGQRTKRRAWEWFGFDIIKSTSFSQVYSITGMATIVTHFTD